MSVIFRIIIRTITNFILNRGDIGLPVPTPKTALTQTPQDNSFILCYFGDYNYTLFFYKNPVRKYFAMSRTVVL